MKIPPQPFYATKNQYILETFMDITNTQRWTAVKKARESVYKREILKLKGVSMRPSMCG
jgi:thermostable 8-oxoguanine DNA glycosylase